MEPFTPKQKKDLKVLVDFVRIYCRAKHEGQTEYRTPADLSGIFPVGVGLCPDCAALLDYSLLRRRNCPLDPKPSCKHCHIHCYSTEYRSRIREIMAFSGRRMIMRGRIDYLWHFFS
ncbi:MAG: nitrous oxide-stimulated promoter family protein [Geobacter sp.]|nr:MAG: nitrous oxide-stimulated promoter family protein [Geobacter sp.]